MNVHLKRSYIALLLAGAFSLPARAAYPVRGGCDMPPATFAHQFFVDPVNGSIANDGSAERPWSTLEQVVNAGFIGSQSYPIPFTPGAALLPPSPNAKVFPGDIVILKNGNHGSVNLRNAYNAGFITIKAAPGEIPVLNRLTLTGGSHFVFDGLTVEGVNGNRTYATGLGGADYYLIVARADATIGPLDNVIFYGGTVQSKGDISGWSRQDMLEKRSSGIFINAGMTAFDFNETTAGSCVSVSSNTVRNIGFGVNVTNVFRAIIFNNVIDRFIDDAIDFGGSIMYIARNLITNSINDGDAFHRDAIQGQPYWGDNTFNRDIQIVDNLIVNQLDPRLPFPACLQGIGAFDGIWKNISVSNNTIITNSYNGIAFYGVDGLTIKKNSVLTDAFPSTCYLPPGDAGDPQSGGPNTNEVQATKLPLVWMAVQDAKVGRASTNIDVENNIAGSFRVTGSGIARNNYIANGLGDDGGVVAGHARPDAIFVAFNPETFRYDLRRRMDSPVPADVGSNPILPIR